MNARRFDPTLAVDLAYLSGAIERWAGDLAMTEEPACFLVALDARHPDHPLPPATGDRGRRDDGR